MTRLLATRPTMTLAVVVMLVVSAACVAAAPILMPDSYSIVEHSVSESAAQGVEGAWLARTGLLLLGFAVLTLAGLAGRRWGKWGRAAHRSYGVAIIASAVFAHMPWEQAPFDRFEDTLHSLASFAVGLAFVVGVIAVAVMRGTTWSPARVYDLVALVASVVIPLVMFNLTGVAGLVQRVMFAIAYIWYGMEALRSAVAVDTMDLVDSR